MGSEVVALVVGPEPSAAPDMMAVGLFEGKIEGEWYGGVCGEDRGEGR